MMNCKERNAKISTQYNQITPIRQKNHRDMDCEYHYSISNLLFSLLNYIPIDKFKTNIALK